MVDSLSKLDYQNKLNLNLLGNIFFKSLGVIILFVTFILLAKNISVSDFGKVQAFFSYLVFLTVFLSFGLELYNFNSGIKQKDKEKTHYDFLLFKAVSLIYFFVALIAVAINNYLLFFSYVELFLMSLIIYFNIITTLVFEFQRGLGKNFKYSLLSGFIHNFIFFILILISKNYYFIDILSFIALSYLAAFLYAIHILFKFKNIKSSKSINLISIIRKSVGFYTFNLLIISTNTIPIIFLSLFGSAHELGLFGFGQKIVSIPQIIYSYFVLLTLSQFVKSFKDGSYENIIKYKYQLKILSFCFFILFIIYFFSFSKIIDVISSEYEEAGFLSVILFFAFFINTLTGPLSHLFIHVGYSKWINSLNFYLLIFLVFFITILYINYSLIGIAVAIALYQFVLNSFLFFKFKQISNRLRS